MSLLLPPICILTPSSVPYLYPSTHRIGAIIALVGNEQVNRNVNNFNQELSSVIGDLREYVNTSVFVSASRYVCRCK